ncbi:MAG TPA: SBBP repeat-containing protein [Nitrososphaeraceae archaeon]|nr:SBBP repeat-containing protein [Nitrososphaeraceae archaeon]
MKLARMDNTNSTTITTFLAHARRVTLVILIMASFTFAIANIHFANAQQIEFIVQFGTSDIDSAEDVFADSSGGVYVVGFTDDTLPDQTSEGDRDAFIRKYDSDGDEIWTRQFGTSDLDEATGVSADSSGGVYVVGDTDGSLPDQPNEGSLDAFIRKYDSDGDEIWTRQFGTSLQDNAVAVSADSSGGVYVVGITFGVFEGETSASEDPDIFDIFIRKYDSDGDEIWTRQFGTSDDSIAEDVFADSSGVYVVGSVDDALPDQTSEGLVDAFIRKYDSDGDEIWTRQFGTSGRDAAEGVSADSSGVYVVGFTEQEDAEGVDDAFIRKYDSDGDEIWIRQFGTSFNDNANAVSADSSGIYVAGVTDGSFPDETSEGDFDIFVRKYNSDGDEIWTQQFGSSEFDITNGVSVDTSGVYVAGETFGTLPGETSLGDGDAFLAKLGIDDDMKKHQDDDKNHHDDDAMKKH